MSRPHPPEPTGAPGAADEPGARLAHLLEQLPGGVAAADARGGRFVYANLAFRQMMGYTPEEIPKLTPEHIHPPESAGLARREFARAATGGAVHLRDILMRRKDGTTFPAEIRASVAEFDGIRAVVGLFTDVSTLKRANEELDRKTALILSLLDALPDIVFYKDADGVYLDCNAEFCRHVGRAREEVLGRTDHDLYPSSFADRFRQHDLAVLRDGVARREEESLHYPDGRVVVVETLKAPFGASDGTLLGVIGICRDITDRKRAEQESARGSLLRDLLMDISSSFISVAAEQLDEAVDQALARLGGFVDADRAYIFDYKWSLDACSNTHEWCRQGVTPEIDNLRALPLSVLPGWPEAHRAGQDIFIRDVLALAPGPLREILESQDIKSLLTVPIGEGRDCLGFVGFDFVRRHRDYSETERRLLRVFSQMLAGIHLRHRAERDYRTLFREVLEGMAVLDVIVDAHGKPVDCRFLAANPAFEQITGLRAADVVGRTVLEVLPGIEPAWIERFSDVALTGEPLRLTQMIQQLGKTLEVTTFRPTPNQFACILQDVSDRVRAEEEARRLQEELLQAQKMESIGRLAGGVAHDFNNMLSVIIGHGELALDKLAPGSQARADVNEVLKAAHRSAELTRQLLAFARRQAVAPRVLDLNHAVESMIKMLRRLIGEHVELRWLPAPGPALVRIDPAQVDQLLANLAVNARDAIGPGGGQVTISTAVERVAAGEPPPVASLSPGEHVVLRFDDDGCGMEQDVLAHACEPFYTTKEMGRGTGLGLATVHGVVLQNGGAIDVQSAPGQGTRFAIYLPRITAEGPSALPKATSEVAFAGNGTILLVEDERTILELARRVLERQGYSVLAAAAPEEALRLAGEHDAPLDLLVTDVIMPGMNGRELALQLQAQRPALRVLFMSGYTSDIISNQGLLQEGSAFLQKPFRVRDLAAKVREALGQPDTF